MPTPPVSGVLAWYAADEIPGAPSSGSPLSSWNDLSANATNMTAVSGSQPLYETDLQEGLPGVVFTTSDFMQATMNPTPEWTLFVVIQPTVDGGGAVFAPSTDPSGLGIGHVAQWQMGNASSGTGFSLSMPQLVTGQQSTAADTSLVRVNGVQTATSTVGDNRSTNDTVTLNAASSTSGDNPAAGTYFEILVYNSVLTTAQIETVETYLYDKWFVAPVPNPGNFLAFM